MSSYQTEQRKKLISIFKKSPHQSFSAQEIHNLTDPNSISLSAVYRNLVKMEQEGVLCKVSEKKRSGTLYQYVDPEHCAGIIHFKCNVCEQTFHLNKSISQMVINIAKEDYSFLINGASAFLYGECEKCSQNRQ
ncbi:MAG: transcriptional repressor [Clostridia bacterium]